ncbi:hypothetical protein CDAR_4651 [Caerostris darwini]|uniref:Uncharacterized protein n=1 Tax=Caerostris darwini TaxID=1538125 RepID=A0AAV4P6V8_9ARAC|nr:hypothetical protein CDAR_4651 [Caerostris darwini]
MPPSLRSASSESDVPDSPSSALAAGGVPSGGGQENSKSIHLHVNDRDVSSDAGRIRREDLFSYLLAWIPLARVCWLLQQLQPASFSGPQTERGFSFAGKKGLGQVWPAIA